MPYKFNSLRDTMNMGGDSEDQADEEQKRQDIVASGDPMAIKRQALKDQMDYYNSPDFKSKGFFEKMAANPPHSAAQEADMKNTMNMVTAGTLGPAGGIESAGAGSGLRSLRGLIQSTAGRTAPQAEAAAAAALERPGLAQSIRQAAMKSSVPQMAAKDVALTVPEDMSLLERIKLAAAKSGLQ